MTESDVETRRERDSEAVFGCVFCGRPFAREEYRTLHYGLDHEAELDDEQRAAYDAALEDERTELRKFQLLAALGLVLVYFGFLILWAVVNLLL